MAFIKGNELEFNTDNGKALVQIDKRPSLCPICDHKIDPIFLRADDSSNNLFKSRIVEALLKCSRPECNRTFIAQYKDDDGRNESASHKPVFILQKLIPDTEIHLEKDSNILRISPRFYEIYFQSLTAEKLGLLDICGSGYRKSLEFIIKDYCIYHFPEKREEIINNDSLMQSIRRTDSPDIIECAERAAWLGNDQTHYEKIHKAEDLETLKDLIALTMYSIQMKMKRNELISRINKKK